MAEDSALIPVNVAVAGRSYRIRIRAADEAFVRASVKRANAQIAELRRTYAGKDEQDFIAMCLLVYATDQSSAGTFVEEELEALSRKIDAVL